MNGGLIYTSTPSIGQLVSAFARTCAAQPSLQHSKQLDSQTCQSINLMNFVVFDQINDQLILITWDTQIRLIFPDP